MVSDTSQEAYDSIDTTRLEALVYKTIYGFGSDGCISDEVRDKHPALAYSSVTARYSKLLDKGVIVDTGRRRPGYSGRNQRVVAASCYPLQGELDV
jgi:hypothetical protein